MEILFALLIQSALAGSGEGLRSISATSCDVVRVNLALGMTTQVVLEQEPKLTLYADKQHYLVKTDELAPRSLAIIPMVEPAELDPFRNQGGALPGARKLAQALDRSLKTNLFVFFENSNQLMFELRFVRKEKADHILKVKQKFSEDCPI